MANDTPVRRGRPKGSKNKPKAHGMHPDEYPASSPTVVAIAFSIEELDALIAMHSGYSDPFSEWLKTMIMDTAGLGPKFLDKGDPDE